MGPNAKYLPNSQPFVTMRAQYLPNSHTFVTMSTQYLPNSQTFVTVGWNSASSQKAWHKTGRSWRGRGRLQGVYWWEILWRRYVAHFLGLRTRSMPTGPYYSHILYSFQSCTTWRTSPHTRRSASNASTWSPSSPLSSGSSPGTPSLKDAAWVRNS